LFVKVTPASVVKEGLLALGASNHNCSP